MVIENKPINKSCYIYEYESARVPDYTRVFSSCSVYTELDQIYSVQYIRFDTPPPPP